MSLQNEAHVIRWRMHFRVAAGRCLRRAFHRLRFGLKSDGAGGTDLHLIATEVPESSRMEMVAGWVSVLMAMKAAVDHGVDLRNHDSSRAWEQGYADN